MQWGIACCYVQCYQLKTHFWAGKSGQNFGRKKQYRRYYCYYYQNNESNKVKAFMFEMDWRVTKPTLIVAKCSVLYKLTLSKTFSWNARLSVLRARNKLIEIFLFVKRKTFCVMSIHEQQLFLEAAWWKHDRDTSHAWEFLYVLSQKWNIIHFWILVSSIQEDCKSLWK